MWAPGVWVVRDARGPGEGLCPESTWRLRMGTPSPVAEPQAQPPCCTAFTTDLGVGSCRCGTSHIPWGLVSYRTQLLASPHPGMALPGHTATIMTDA